MARQRFIHPDIWTDPDIGRLSPLARLLFIGCFSNADDEGRLPASPAYLRNSIFPYDDISLEDIGNLRAQMVANCKNVALYESDGNEYLAFTKWATFQRPRYAKPSRLPPPPAHEPNVFAESLQLNGCKTDATPPQGSADIAAGFRKIAAMGLDSGSGLGLDSDSGCGSGLGCFADEPPQTHPAPHDAGQTQSLTDAAPGERAVLKELKQVAGYPFEYEQDLTYIRSLTVDFPTVDILTEVKKWRVYKMDKPLAKKSNPRLQFRNWLTNAQRFKRERCPPETLSLPDRGNAIEMYERENAEKGGADR